MNADFRQQRGGQKPFRVGRHVVFPPPSVSFQTSRFTKPMPLSIDVIVHRESVVFPQRCVICDLEAIGEVVELRGNPVGLFGVIPWLLRRTRKLAVPAHAHCGSRLARAILARNLSLIIGVTAVVILAIPLGLSKWQAIGLAATLIVLPILWQVMRPLPFEFTHHGDCFKLMFSNRSYARDVAELNDGQIDDDEVDE